MSLSKLEVKPPASPSWDTLYAVVEAQQGCFTRDQAHQAGFSDQLLQKHLKGGNIERLHRGIYRLTRFPASSREQEDLVVVWLWSLSAGVFSHETALRLHDLSDALPARIHLTLPPEWEHRRLNPPQGVSLYFAKFGAEDSTFVGAVPVTKPTRSINDVAMAHGDAGIVEAAVRQSIQRGSSTPAELLPAVDYLATFRKGAWRVQPEADLNGSWRMEIVSGVCPVVPRADWRMETENFATSVGSRLRAAAYCPASRTMTMEMVWPEADRLNKPSPSQLRDAAVARFGWTT